MADAPKPPPEADESGVPPWPDFGAAKADVGILCVHGIGVQAEGDTLLAVAETLLSALGSDDAKVVYGEASLKPLRMQRPEPAHLCATVEDGPGTTRAIVAESWWAGAFDAPSYWNLLGWLLSYGTWIAIRHATFRISALVRYFERKFDRAGKPRPDWLGFADVMFAYPGTLVSVFLVAIPLQVLLLAIGLLAIIPFKLTQNASKRMAIVISETLGDATVFTANAAIRHSILSRVRADLEWLSARSNAIVVLAHSQGAAVVFDLFRRMPKLANIRLITYGEGIRKLSELEQDAERKPFTVQLCASLWLFGLVAIVLAWFGAVYTIESIATPGAAAISDRVGSLLLFYAFTILVLMLGFYFSARSRDAEVDRQLEGDVAALLGRGLQWSDLYASSDPVPGGPLLGARVLQPLAEGWRADVSKLAGFRSREVVNRLSAFADHTTYWNTPNDFVPAVARQIREWLHLPSLSEPMNLGRKRRMIFRKLAGLALFIAAGIVFVRAGDPLRDLLIVPVLDAVPIDPLSLTGRIVARYRLREIATFVFGLAIFLGLAWAYVRFVITPAWNAWERTIQRYRSDAFAGADNLIGILAKFSHSIGPAVRFVICVLVIAMPLWLLAGPLLEGQYAPGLETMITLGEWVRGLVGILLWGIIALWAVGMIAVAFAWVKERLGR